MLFAIADCIQPFSYGITCFILDNEVRGVSFSFFKFIVLLAFKYDLSTHDDNSKIEQ